MNEVEKRTVINMYLDIFNFIVDIRPGPEHPTDNEINFFTK